MKFLQIFSLRFFGSISLSLVARVIGIINIVLIIPIVVNNYTVEEFALFSILTQTIVIYGFLDLGIGAILINEIIRLRNKGYFKILRTVAYQTLGFVTLIGFALFIISIGLYLFLGVSVLENEFSAGVLELLDNDFIKLSIVFFLVLPTTLIQKIQFGFVDNMIFHFVEIIQKTAQIIVIYYLVRNGNNILDLVFYFYLILLISNLINLGIYFFFIRKDVFLSKNLVKRNYIPRLVRLSFYYFLGSLLFFFSRTLDTYLIGFFGSFEELKDYEIIKRPFDIGLTSIMIVTSVLWPILGEANQKKQFKKVKKLLRMTIVGVFLGMTILLLLMVIIGNPILKIWINDSIYFSMDKFIWIGLVFLLYGIGNILVTYLNSVSAFLVQVKVYLALAIIGIPLKIFFLQKGGLDSYLISLTFLLIFVYVIPMSVVTNNKLKSFQ